MDGFQWFQLHVFGLVANFVTFGYLKDVLVNPDGWAVGASLLAGARTRPHETGAGGGARNYAGCGGGCGARIANSAVEGPRGCFLLQYTA